VCSFKEIASVISPKALRDQRFVGRLKLQESEIGRDGALLDHWGREYVYTVEREGRDLYDIEIYSVGANGIDEGGHAGDDVIHLWGTE
jgi:hypothetical protein